MTEDELEAALVDLDGWAVVDGQITKQYRLVDFPAAVTFVVRLSFLAEAADHHPEVDIRYNRVRITLSTHSAGGITAKDLSLARAIEAVAVGG